EHQDLRATHWSFDTTKQAADAIHREERHLQIGLRGGLDELGVEVEFARLPRKVVRVDRYAMPTDSGTGVERHEAVGLRRGGVDHFPDIDVHALAQHRQLVDESDVHGA